MGGGPSPITAPFGTWRSPIDVETIFKKTTTLADIVVDKKLSKVYHLESRPHESGRAVLVSSNGQDVVPTGYNVRTRVHEYGGAASIVNGGKAYFSDFASSRVWSVDVRDTMGEPVGVTEESSTLRYADFSVHPINSNIILAVREDHTIDEPSKVVNTIVCIDAETQKQWVVREGKDFYSFPRFSEDGKMVLWLEWSHPDMPWEGTELHVATFNLPSSSSSSSPPSITNATYIAGKHDSESIHQPMWSSCHPGRIYFLSDRSGGYQLYSYEVAHPTTIKVVTSLKEELAEPAWSFGQSTYCILTEKDALILPIKGSITRLSHLNLETKVITEINNKYNNISQLQRVSSDTVVFIGGVHNGPTRLVTLTIDSNLTPKYAEKATDPIPFDKIIFSKPECITVQTTFPPPGATAAKGVKPEQVDLYCVLYPPTNPDYQGEPGEMPPTLVQVHGGPTGRSAPKFDYFYQYFTSRGFAVLDVDYGGSSGYGREYRQRLKGNWGIVDVYDSQRAVTALAEMGKIDGKRVAIRGGSAGGYTTLACLTDSKVFSAGVSLYGVADLKLLADDTHKFESQYLFKLIGGTPTEVPEIYHDRSPLHKAEKITASLLVLQGLDDKVVPPEQARVIVKKINDAKGDVEAVYYEGEGHGFRKLENQKDSLIRTRKFLKRVFEL